MSDQIDPISNEPIMEFKGLSAEQPTRTNGAALFGMIFAVLPTIIFVLLLAFVYILLQFRASRTWNVWVEVFGLMIGVFMFASYPLAFILGIIGLRQISKSEGREKGKNLAWTAIALSSAYFLLIWVLPFGSLIYNWTFNRNLFFEPVSAPEIRPTNVPVSIARSTLSGTWTGTETLTAVGSCKLEQGNRVTNPVKMVWQVNEQGEAIVMLSDWPGVYPYTFKGNVQPDLSFSLDFSTSAMCGGNKSPYSAIYDGVIRTDGDTLKLDMEATEVWCPGTCVFLRHYSVQKTSSGP